MAEISIITFKRHLTKMLIIRVPTQIEHWGIYIKYNDKDHSQFIYHADKQSITDYNTKFLYKEWSKDGDLLKKDRANKVDARELVGYSSYKLTHEEMINICTEVSKNRVFNTIINNCQEWVKTVLSELIDKGYLSKSSLDDFISENKITPLRGW